MNDKNRGGHEAVLPEGVSVRKLGSWGRLGLSKYHPVKQYGFPSGMTVIECANPDWPVLISGGVGEHHVFPASRATVEEIIETIGNKIFGGGEMPRFRVFAPKPREHRYLVGDDIEIAFEWGSWGIKKLREGMAPERVKEQYLKALAEVLRIVLKNH